MECESDAWIGENDKLFNEICRLSKEHMDIRDIMKEEHMNIRDIMKEVHFKQELQRKIIDKLPDAKRLKEDIYQIYMETMDLKIELKMLKNEMQKVNEKNKEILVELQHIKNSPNRRKR